MLNMQAYSVVHPTLLCLLATLTGLAVSREVSIWREATNKLACVTSPELTKDISGVHCMEPLSDLVVAVGCEGGRVVILKLLGQYSEKEHSQMAQILTPSGTAHDDKKQIVKVRMHTAGFCCAPLSTAQLGADTGRAPW
jgi:hypothetical protein